MKDENRITQSDKDRIESFLDILTLNPLGDSIESSMEKRTLLDVFLFRNKLIWHPKIELLSWNDASDYSEKCKTFGMEWRLPTSKELCRYYDALCVRGLEKVFWSKDLKKDMAITVQAGWTRPYIDTCPKYFLWCVVLVSDRGFL